jgi:methylmalonyl-CoA mutase N-terminal domain/subunit
VAGRDLKIHYTPADLNELEYERDIGDPGQFPYTRGVHATGYRGKVWTMRQFAGFGTPEETNRRYRQLLSAGGTGLSVAFDLPTLMGRDPDHPLAAPEVGRCGVSVACLADMQALFEGIDLARVTTSMTINGPAAMLFAMYLVAAERQGAAWPALSGTIQNDILKEFIAQKEYIYPPRPSMRLVTDLVAFATREAPRWHPISISGYHIREAGATAAEELAFTLADGLEYVGWAVRAGLPVDAFAPRLSFFFNAHSDFFEEIAKFRAARRMWARFMRDRFGAADERSWKLRFHAQTAGVSLTAQQPYNNVVRTALEALAAVLGGANSLHTNALDEALALPTEDAARLALRTQQILAHETGLVDVVDPFGGSWTLERLTLDIDRDALQLIAAIDAQGGMVAAVEAGFPQRRIADSAYAQQRAIETGERAIVGVNCHVHDAAEPIPTLAIDDRVGDLQRHRVAETRRRRDARPVEAALADLRAAAAGSDNLMPAILAAVRAEATLGEMVDALKDVWGEWTEGGDR